MALSVHDVPLEIVKPGLTTTYTYSTEGRLETVTQTDTTTHTVPYTTAERERVWAITYTTGGLIESIDGPLPGTDDVVEYEYDADGYLAQVTNELGQITEVVSVNGRGQPTEITDPNGVTTLVDYDGEGSVTTILRNPGANQVETDIVYNEVGDVLQLIRPDGSYLEYTYDDARRVTSIESDSGERIEYDYNDARQPTAVTVKSATPTIVATREMVYDEMMRLRRAIGAGAQETVFTYDKVSNLNTITDPRSNLFDEDFDNLDRLVKETDPDSGETTLAYDERDNLTSVTDARDLETTYVVDGFGDVIRRTSPDTGTTDYERNEQGLVTSMTDARGVVVDFTYDALGRVLTKTFPAASAENVTYGYDDTTGGNYGVGHLTSVEDESGTTEFTYDALGNLIGVERTFGTAVYLTAYEYDSAGRIIGIAYPSGRLVAYERDSTGRVIGVTTKAGPSASVKTVVDDVNYQPFQPADLFADGAAAPSLDSPHLAGLSSLTFGNGLDLLLGYDEDGRLTDMEVADGTTTVQDLTLDYDESRNVIAIADNLDSGRSQTFGYDNLDRLNAASGPYGDIDYTYDLVGNRTARTIDNGTLTEETYEYPSTSNRLTSVTVGTSVREFEYTAAGSVSSDTRASATFTSTFNKNGRLVTISADAGPMQSRSYRYDAFGHRVSEDREDRVGGNTQDSGRAYVYDQAGHLIAEYDESLDSYHTATLRQEYIWLGDTPVAMLEASDPDDVRFVHADHLGRPQKITGDAQDVVWDGQFDPFGEEYAVTGAIGMPLRFPGQEWDEGTGLRAYPIR